MLARRVISQTVSVSVSIDYMNAWIGHESARLCIQFEKWFQNMSTVQTRSFDGESTFTWDPETRQCKSAHFAGEKEPVTLDGLCLSGDQPDHTPNPKLPRFSKDKDLVLVNPRVTLSYRQKDLLFVDPVVEQYGLSVPRWVFFLGLDHSHCKIDPKIFDAIKTHTLRWTQSEPEVLGQTTGFLAWQVEYQQDQAWNPDTEEWEDSDEFDNPLAQPFEKKQGDCEDMTRMMLLCFSQVPLQLCPLKSKYCACALDTVIRCPGSEDGLHAMCVLIPWCTLDQRWLPQQHRKPNSDKMYELPILVLESTDRTRTEFKRSQQAYDWFSNWVHDNLFGRETRKCSYPFVDKSYRAQSFYKKFMTLYSPQLFERTGVASWHILVGEWWGCSLDQLVDQVEVRLEPRQEQVDRKQAQLFIDRCCPKLQDVSLPPSIGSVKGVPRSGPLKHAVPLYMTKEELKAEWPDLSPQIVAEDEVLGEPVVFVATNTQN